MESFFSDGQVPLPFHHLLKDFWIWTDAPWRSKERRECSRHLRCLSLASQESSRRIVHDRDFLNQRERTFWWSTSVEWGIYLQAIQCRNLYYRVVHQSVPSDIHVGQCIRSKSIPWETRRIPLWPDRSRLDSSWRIHQNCYSCISTSFDTWECSIPNRRTSSSANSSIASIRTHAKELFRGPTTEHSVLDLRLFGEIFCAFDRVDQFLHSEKRRWNRPRDKRMSRQQRMNSTVPKLAV